MRKLPKILLGLIVIPLYLFLGDLSDVGAVSTLASQTQSYSDSGTSWAFSQDLGNSLTGTPTSITIRLSTTSTIDALAPNSFLVDKTNNFQQVAHGCVPSNVDPHGSTRGLTILMGNGVPDGYEDITIDLSCADYDFILGHSYMFVWSNANSYNLLTFTGHRGSHTDHRDIYSAGGGVYYAASGVNANNCFSLVGEINLSNYAQNCYSWDTDAQNSSATDDLYFRLEGNPPLHPTLPIIFIPGIGGSELTASSDISLSIDNGHNGTFSHSYSSGEKVWVNQNEAAALGEDDYFDVLKLKSDGVTPEAPLTTNGSLTPFGYGEVDSFFQNLGYQKGTNYFTFPYDWRLDAGSTTQALDTLIEHAKQTSGQNKVVLVAHSMGGLVARNYIADTTRAAKVDKLIEMGVPHLGAVDSLKGLVYGKSLNYTIAFFSLPLIPSSEIKDLFKNLTSGFELLPTSQYFNFYTNANELVPYPYFDDRDIDNNGITGALNYSQIKTLLSNLSFNMTVFNLAESFHNTIDPSLNQTNGVHLYEIVGTGIPTLGQIKETWWISWPLDLINKKDEYFINGDDTVPLYSASLKSESVDLSAGARIYYLTTQRHEDMPKQDGEAMQIVKKILTEDPTLVENLKTKLEGTQVSIDGGDIDLYDSSGNHTGLKTDGSVEENIPGTFYSGSENTKHVFIKKTANTVTVKSKAATVTSKTGETAKPKKVTIRTRTYRDDSVQSTAVYPPISTGDTTEIDFPIDPQSSTPPTLSSYPDPTSANTQTGGTNISPASQISDNNVLDQTPPTTTATSSGTLNSSGNYTNSATVTLTANDSGSGVLSTNYSLDGGQTIQDYTAPFAVTSPGTTTIFAYSTDKVGNQETPHSITFTIVASDNIVATTSSSSNTSSSGNTPSSQTTVLAVSTPTITNPQSNSVPSLEAIKDLLPFEDKISKDVLGAKNSNLLKASSQTTNEAPIGDLFAGLGLSVGFLSLSFLSSLSDLQQFGKASSGYLDFWKKLKSK